MSIWPSYRIFSLGDSCVTLDFGNLIDESVNKKVISLFHFLNEHPLPGMSEAVPAYSSITIYYDLFQIRKRAAPGKTVAEWVIEELEKRLDVQMPEDDSLPR